MRAQAKRVHQDLADNYLKLAEAYEELAAQREELVSMREKLNEDEGGLPTAALRSFAAR